MTRQFNVYVLRQDKKVLQYPALNGEKTLALMLSMQKRGFETVAETTANNITEQLTLIEIIDIFA